MNTLKALAATSLLFAGLASSVPALASPLNQQSAAIPKATEFNGLQQQIKDLKVQKDIGTQGYWGRGYWGRGHWGRGYWGRGWGYPWWRHGYYGRGWGYPWWGHGYWGRGHWGRGHWGRGHWGRW
jgi:hypothetical protein